jgi:hypothetical protein
LRLAVKQSQDCQLAAIARWLPFPYNSIEPYRSIGKLDPAHADAREAVRLDPHGAKAFDNRGAMFVGKGQHQRPIEDYHQPCGSIRNWAWRSTVTASNMQAPDVREPREYAVATAGRGIDDFRVYRPLRILTQVTFEMATWKCPTARDLPWTSKSRAVVSHPGELRSGPGGQSSRSLYNVRR